ncbi:hypothetical protein MKW98_004087 [Papaver atlanticum]|uniref:Uncharacterized protein n=1 Tax=Papaver atlanticum TaxID=357466 RepID=A0AAD4XLR5_9MAGN|nr:hypothetical protein MKW98_004087 [Papaver atlanticum]
MGFQRPSNLNMMLQFMEICYGLIRKFTTNDTTSVQKLLQEETGGVRIMSRSTVIPTKNFQVLPGSADH